MRLEYNLASVKKAEELEDFKLELAPRNQCKIYVEEHGGKATLLERKDFDDHYKNKKFSDGPYKDGFGDGYGEPYNPNRQGFGKLKSGLVVYCETSEVFKEKTAELFKKLEKNPHRRNKKKK